MRNANWTLCDHFGFAPGQQKKSEADNAIQHLGNRKNLLVFQMMAKAAAQQEPSS